MPQNASIFWSDLNQAMNMNNTELVLFHKIFLCYMHYRNNITYLNNEETQVNTVDYYIQRRGKHAVINMYLRRTMHYTYFAHLSNLLPFACTSLAHPVL